ncbi:MAG TPA: tetratricopeptide repeat protein [Abditibacterium sp.]
MPLSPLYSGNDKSIFCRCLSLGLISGTLLFVSDARAQNGITLPGAPPLNAVPTATIPTAPAINILLIALDDLPTPGTIAPTAPLLPALPAPPAADGIAPAITPARWGEVSAPFWLGHAQKPKRPTEDDLFRLEPDSRALLPPGRTQPTAPSELLPAPLVDVAPTNSAPLLPPGRAQLVAVPLRRALLSLGWSDVLPTAPDAAAIVRAIGERRLSPRAIEELRSAIAQLAAPGTPPGPETTSRATAAATRIGQALGYRAVVAFYVASPVAKEGAQNAAFSMILADSARETGEAILYDEKGASESALRDAGASTAAALLDRAIRAWPESSNSDRAALAQKHLEKARAAIEAGDSQRAQDELNQAVALDSSRGEPYVLLGDLLSTTDPLGAASAYRRAVELNARDGATWAKIAVAYTTGTVPDWPRSLEAARKALAANYDSVPLRVAMATAQFGRADLFRKAERLDRAEDAEFDARKHLDRALELAPDDPIAVRLLARKLVEARRFDEAAQTLDRVAPRYPKDLEIQTQYAAALTGQIGREEDAFVAYAKVWKLSGIKNVDVDALTYRALAQGFDLRVRNLGKSAIQLTTGVANGALPREDALLQLTKLKEDMSSAENAINVLRAPASIAPDGPASRVFAADLMNQALEAQQIYLETGQDLQRSRGGQLANQAVARLNAARGRN